MMEETSWSLIAAAAAGSQTHREGFMRRYRSLVETILAARWRESPMLSELDDAVQEVFIACFKDGGALERALEVGQGFRSFLLGITRNVARHMERTHARRVQRVKPGLDEHDVSSEDSGLSREVDQAYAHSVVREALETMETRARAHGDGGESRVALLKERFEKGLPIRDIARIWDVDPRQLHLEQAKAGREFRAALREVIGINERCSGSRLDAECERLLKLLR